MKTWKTIALSVITTSALVTAGALTYSYSQPTHYKGDTFTNAKTSVSSTTSSTSSSSSSQSESTNNNNTNTNTIHTESNSAEVTNNYSQEVNNSSQQVNNNQSQQTNNNTTTQVEQNTGDRAYQPTFKVECVSPKNDLYCVVHIPTGDKCKAITYVQAESFCTYMEQIAYGETSLSHTMDENYNTWATTSSEANE